MFPSYNITTYSCFFKLNSKSMKEQKTVSATLKFNLLIKLDTVGLNTGIFYILISVLVLCNEHNETLLLVQDEMLCDCIPFLLLL